MNDRFRGFGSTPHFVPPNPPSNLYSQAVGAAAAANLRASLEKQAQSQAAQAASQAAQQVKPAKEMGVGGVVQLASWPIEHIAQSPSVKTFERLWTVQPNDSWYDPVRNPSNTNRVEIGSYLVPDGQAVLITYFDFLALQPTGVGAFESEPVPEGRLGGTIGFYFDVNGTVPGVVNFELEPTPSNFQRRQFRPKQNLVPMSERVAADYERTAATSYAAGSFGTGLLPTRHGRTGDPNARWSVLVMERQNVNLSMLIYRPIPYPLCGIRGRICGYTCSKQLMVDMVEALASK